MTVQMSSDQRMPRGRSFPGLRHSSAVVLTASKPMKAKKMMAAPAWMPRQPWGTKGCQLAGLMNLMPRPTTASRMITLTTTMTLFTRALSLMPT